MQFLKESFKWDSDGNYKYYHLEDCDIIDNAVEGSSYDNDTLITITEFNNEIQTTTRRKRTKDQ